MIDERFYTRLGPLSLSDCLSGLSVNSGEADLSLVIHDAASLDNSLPGQISYYGGKAYKAQLETAKGTACLCYEADSQLVNDAGLIPLIAEYPRAVFASIIEQLYIRKDFTSSDPLISPDAKISESAKIMPGAVIGSGAVISDSAIIGPNAVIYPGVHIGARTRVDANATVMCVVVGENCHIHSAACIGGDGFGVAESEQGARDIPHIGAVELHDNVSIGYGTMVDRGMLGNTIIRSGTKIDNLCQIAHNCTIGSNTMIAGHTGIAGSCHIGSGVLMGGRVGIADHLSIGDGARLSASALLMRDIPAGEFWGGFPAKPMRQYMREVATLARMAKPQKKNQKQDKPL